MWALCRGFTCFLNPPENHMSYHSLQGRQRFATRLTKLPGHHDKRDIATDFFHSAKCCIYPDWMIYALNPQTLNQRRNAYTHTDCASASSQQRSHGKHGKDRKDRRRRNEWDERGRTYLRHGVWVWHEGCVSSRWLKNFWIFSVMQSYLQLPNHTKGSMLNHLFYWGGHVSKPVRVNTEAER